MPRPLALPAYVINGVAVATGVGLMLALGQWIDPLAAMLLSSGATVVSLADQPGTPRRVGRATLGAAVLSLVATAVAVFTPPGWALALGVAGVAFMAQMALAWGARAGAMSFAPLLALVFALGHPDGEGSSADRLGWTAAGMVLYLGWALLASRVLQPVYRRRALSEALASMASLLRSRAEVLHSGAQARALSELIGVEAVLATRLQTARDLIFADVYSATGRREAAILLRIIDLRDALMASRLDLDLLGEDAAGLWLRERLAQALRDVADALTDPRPASELLQGEAMLQRLFDAPPLRGHDPRQRLLPLVTDRLRVLVLDVRRVRSLLHGAEEVLPLTEAELQLFVAPEGWPVRALRAHRGLDSPVLRHALRAALALGCAYLIGRMLPWNAHPHWLVLSVAVVLRGNLEQTLSRRNARVLGTVLGCLFVLALSALHGLGLFSVVFVVAIAVAHAYVNVRYWLTATAATVMALLQAHLVHGGGFSVGERLADTVLGAVLALVFSYVLPSWERRTVPSAMRRTLQALADYAGHALTLGGSPTPAQRLARRAAYDALSGLAAAAQRSTVEPRHVQLPLLELSRLLDHAQQLMAHLSSLRSLLTRRAAELDQPEARVALDDALQVLRSRLSAGVALETALPALTDPAAAMALLPQQPPADDPLPWLMRRLAAVKDEARQVAWAAAEVQRGLSPACPATRPSPEH